MITPPPSPPDSPRTPPGAPMKVRPYRVFYDVSMFYDLEDEYREDGMDLLLVGELLDIMGSLLEDYPNEELRILTDLLTVQYERGTVYEDTFRRVLYGGVAWCEECMD